ncbi:MAG: sensor domain-containing diguanylate cyclase [Candidatus Omnitrophota bacterium]|nr:sensor domain-containing diguanylate cyclase [Candidatus Omnitrophota bacterium]
MITCLFTLSFSSAPSKSYLFFIFLGIILITVFFWQRIKGKKRLNEIKIEKMEEEKRNLILEYEKKKSLSETFNKRLQRYSTLKNVIEVLSSTLSLKELSELIITQTSKVIGKGDTCLLFLIDSKSGGFSLLRQQRGFEFTKMEFGKRGDIFDQWVLRQKQPLIITDIQKDFRFSLDNFNKEGQRSLIIAPVISKERIIGLLRINDKTAYAFSPNDLRLLVIISDFASVTIENALLYQRTEELAIRDGLTSLYVQTYFKKQLAEECEEAKIHKTGLSVLMCDLDYFKEYNDQYGHTAGDILLKRMAEILRQKIGKDGLVARYGGEEFAIILPGKNREQAGVVAEAIRGAIDKEIFLLRRKKTKISVSVGVVSFPQSALDAETLIAGADNALYRAKEQGRNRVCFL